MQDGERTDAESLAEQRRFVEALARRLVLDPHAADDIVQETLLAAMRSPPKRSVRGWLARVVRNLAYRTLRSEERRRRREHRVARPDRVTATADLVARVTWQRKVAGVVLALDEPYRTTLLLRFYEDLQPKEIAERLGVPAATVRTRLKRGLERMRERLDAEHGGDRRAWCLALLPLAFASAPASAATAATTGAVVGVVVMSAKKKLLVAALLLVALAGTVHLGRSVLRDAAPAAERTVAGRATVDGSVSQPEPYETPAKTPVTGGTLRVVVRTLAGQPLEGAEVVVRRAEPGVAMGVPVPDERQAQRWVAQSRPLTTVLARTMTDHTGHAELRGLPGGRWDLLVRHTGYAPRSVCGGAPSPRVRRRPLEVFLGPARPLTGRVLDSEVRPVAGAIVLAGTAGQAQHGGWGTWPARAVADGAGRYEFTTLPAEDLSLWATYPEGVARFVAILRTPGPEQFDITLPHGGIVEGIVTLAGKPVAGAVVAVTDLTHHGSAVTDDSGRYRIDHMPEVSITKIDVWKTGLAQVFKVLRRQNVRVSRHEPVQIDVEMVPGARVAGRVLGPDGPIPRASVGCSTIRADFGNLHRATHADEHGCFRLDGLSPGRHLLRGFAPGYTQPDVPARYWDFLASKEPETRPFVVALKAGEEVVRDVHLIRGPVCVEGWVEGPDGKPVEGAQVQCGSGYAYSGPDGRFVLYTQPRQRDAVVGVFADGLVQVEPQPVITSDTDGVHLRLRRAPRIVGTVRNEFGQPVPGAYVMYGRGTFADGPESFRQAHLDRLWYAARRWPVDKQGAFEIEVVGSFDVYLRAQAPGYAPSAPIQLGVMETADREEVALVLRAAHRLRGHVTCDGNPVAGVHVRLRGPNWQPPLHGEDLSPAAAIVAVTDATGEFEAQVGAGSWIVAASAAGYTGTSVPVSVPGEIVRIELQARLTIEGRMVFADGKPAAGAGIYRWKIDEKGRTVPNQGTQWSNPADEQGRFVLRDLDPGLYQLNIVSRSGVNVVRKKVEPVEAGTKGLRIVVERGYEIAGRLVDEAGNGLPYVGVMVRGQDDPSIRSSDQTDTGGNFQVLGLRRGLYSIEFTKQDEGRSRFSRRRVPTGISDFVVVWGEEDEPDAAELATQIRGRLIDEQGRPVASARVSARPEGSKSGRVDKTDEQGRFAIERLKPARYRMFVSAPGFLRDLDATIETGAADVVLVAKRGLTVHGVVRDENGQPLAGVRVQARATGTGDVYESSKRKTDNSGGFDIAGLPEGQHELQAWKMGYAAVTKDALAGARDIQIVLGRGLKASGTLRDAQGAPLANTVLVFSLITDTEQRAVTKTDMGARFTVRGLLPGRYRVEASVRGKARPCGTVDAGAINAELAIAE